MVVALELYLCQSKPVWARALFASMHACVCREHPLRVVDRDTVVSAGKTTNFPVDSRQEPHQIFPTIFAQNRKMKFETRWAGDESSRFVWVKAFALTKSLDLHT